MLKSLVFILATALWLPGVLASEWRWLRVEAGVPHPVISQGHAVTVVEQSSQLTLKLSDQDKVLNDFMLHTRRSGRNVRAEFEPPNAERGVLRLSGIRHENPLGSGEVWEQMTFADVTTGSFLVVSRIRKVN
ncbi:hypothetical protein [Variovorax sp. HJSM1_2]|uniref:hypothetical protein n=1 Tax=Variovorax sp. HJSM1_2 TaxID=3366263 RepID=UPI003BBE5728